MDVDENTIEVIQLVLVSKEDLPEEASLYIQYTRYGNINGIDGFVSSDGTLLGIYRETIPPVPVG